LINIHAVFGGNKLNRTDLYFDPIHPNDKGNDLIAETVAKRIKTVKNGPIAYGKIPN
jgi:lysophospholipase L1-like esterase